MQKSDYIPQLSIDSVIFGYQDKKLKVLISKLNFGEELYTLPGGFIQQTESIEEAASRILEERTGLKKIYLEQYRAFGAIDRLNNIFDDPTLKNTWESKENMIDLEWLIKRFVSIGFYALIDINKVSISKTEFDESVSWINITELPKLIMDHNEMIVYALEALRAHLDRRLLGFNLLPETFTMKELQQLYEAVYDKPFPNNNFQKKMLALNVLERLDKKFTGAANKAPYMYRFKR